MAPYDVYLYIKGVIESCTTEPQVTVADNLVQHAYRSGQISSNNWWDLGRVIHSQNSIVNNKREQTC